MESPKNATPDAGSGHRTSRVLLQQRLLAVLGEWYGPRATVRSRELLPAAGRSLQPDAVVYGDAPDRPLLAVIILDATTPFGPQVAAARELLAAGVPSCWLVEPTLRTVSIPAAPGGYQSFNQHETLRDPASGIELELARLFG